MDSNLNPLSLLRAIVRNHATQKAAAKTLRISPQLLTDILKRRRNVSAKLLRRLGLERQVTYTRKGAV